MQLKLSCALTLSGGLGYVLRAPEIVQEPWTGSLNDGLDMQKV